MKRVQNDRLLQVSLEVRYACFFRNMADVPTVV